MNVLCYTDDQVCERFLYLGQKLAEKTKRWSRIWCRKKIRAVFFC